MLEIGGYAAGYCGRLFAQAGHDVVRVEGPPGPAWASDEAMALYLHPGKRRVATADAALLAELAGQADVLVVEAANAYAVAALGMDD